MNCFPKWNIEKIISCLMGNWNYVNISLRSDTELLPWNHNGNSSNGKLEYWKDWKLESERVNMVDLTLHCCHFFLISPPKSRKILPQLNNKTFSMFFFSFRSTHGGKKCGGDFFPGLPLQVYDYKTLRLKILYFVQTLNLKILRLKSNFQLLIEWEWV